jgi:hypothetical protein
MEEFCTEAKNVYSTSLNFLNRRPKMSDLTLEELLKADERLHPFGKFSNLGTLLGLLLLHQN